MRIATSPVQQAWLSRQAIWWRGDGDSAFNWNGQPPGCGTGRADQRASRHDLSEQFRRSSQPAIASEARQSIDQRTRVHGLLRRFAPLRKRFAFVAGNDGVAR